jgi:glucose-1-phosphate thymidylyltransferase
MSLQAVILAAGRGTRLQPLTAERSKAMVAVAGRPLIEHVIDSLAEVEPHEIIVVAAPNDSELLDYCARRRFRVVTQESPRGAGDALLRARPLVHSDPFIVSACDSFCEPAHVAALVARHRESLASATLSLLEVAGGESQSGRSAAFTSGDRVIRLIEKPSPSEARDSRFIALPLFILTPAIFPYLEALTPSPRGEIEIQAAIQHLIEAGLATSWHHAARRWQVTTVEDAETLTAEFRARRAEGRAVLPVRS